MTASNNADQTRRGRPFERGNRVGRGRKTGSRNKATLALDKLAEGEAMGIAAKMIEVAKGGDIRAAEMILSRAWPIRKGRPMTLSFGPMETAADVMKALGLVATAMGDGSITPEEAAVIAGVFETKRRAIETADLSKRIEALEAESKK